MSRLKLNLILILVAIAIIIAMIALTELPNPLVKAEEFLPVREIEIVGNEPEPKIIEIKPYKNILHKIEEGQSLLLSSKPLQLVERGNKKKEISLAILDTKTGDVIEKRFWLYQNEIDQANNLRPDICGKLDHFPSFKSENDETNLSVIVNWWNGLNSNLSIVQNDCSEPDRYMVVTSKILIPNTYLAYPEDKTGLKYSDIVYTPYSENLHREELVVEGLKFLNENVSQAYDNLRELGVKSRAFPNKLVVDTLDQQFVKNIFINEQSDPTAMLSSPEGGKKTAERALIRLGTNREKAFRYTFSSVGALGLAQIMPTTYQNIVREYPEAILIKDVDIGRANILNSIKASILVHDDHYAAVVRRSEQTAQSRKLLSSKSQDEIENIKAAIYNGGPGKYNYQAGTISLAIPETVSFLMKLDFIRKLNLFD